MKGKGFAGKQNATRILLSKNQNKRQKAEGNVSLLRKNCHGLFPSTLELPRGKILIIEAEAYSD